MSTIGNSHLRFLAVFACVVESGSFANAARRLNSSRSRVSEQVSQLEQGLGVRLLQRSTRQLIVTDEGHRVYHQARKLPQILQQVESVVAAQQPSGRVAITMNHDTAHRQILPRLAEFRAQYPQVELDIIVDDERRDLIFDNIDLAIRVGLPRDESVVARPLYEDRMQLFASPPYLTKTGKLRTRRELEARDWILLQQEGFGDHQRFVQNGHSIELRPRQAYRCNSPYLVQEMVLQGLGVAALLPCMIRHHIASGALTRVMPSIESEPLTISLVYPSRKHIPQRTRAAIDFLLGAELFTEQTSSRNRKNE